MKYIQNIKEYANKSSKSDTHYSRFIINNVKSFCDMYLADLIDKGFNIQVSYDSDIPLEGNIFCIMISNKERFDWDYIKDDFIPFLQFLNEEYDLVDLYGKDEPVVFRTVGDRGFRIQTYQYSVESVLNDKVSVNKYDPCMSIEILINKELY